MKQRKSMYKLISMVLIIAMVLTSGMVNGVPKQAKAAVSTKKQVTVSLNATETYLNISNKAGNTYNFNIIKTAQEEGATYNWYIKSDKGDPDCVTINAKTGIVTAKKAGTAYIRCKVTLADGTVVRPEAKVTVRNNITKVDIKNLPENQTITAGQVMDFNRNIVNTQAGRGATTEGVTRWEISDDTANVGSASANGEVFPTTEGKFKIRAICFQSNLKYVLWAADKEINAQYITAASKWYTIKVVSSNGIAVTKNQEQLSKALASDEMKHITLISNKAAVFNIAEGDYSSKSLIVNAPNADVKNYGVFKDITIKAIKDTTWSEFAKGNNFLVMDKKASMVVDQAAAIKKIVMSANRAELNLVSNGVVDEIAIERTADLTLTGTMAASVLVAIQKNAAGSTLTSSLPLKLDLQADADITLNQGAEGTIINKSDSDVEVTVKNDTVKPVVITTNNTDKETIEAGKEGTSDGTKPTVTVAPTVTTKPSTTETPKPTATVTPKPTAATSPEPTATTVPEPTSTTAPEPTSTTAPEPTSTTAPEPTATTAPEPTSTTAPEPTATTAPEPTVTTAPEPTATIVPEPTVTSAPEPTIAGDYYVALNGSDDNDGSANSPYLTVDKAVSQLKPGETLVIREGDYTDQIFNIVGLKGSEINPINIIGEGNVTFLKSFYNGNTGKNCTGNLQSCEYVNVSNIHFHFQSDSAAEAQTLLTVSCTNVKVSHCLFTADQNGGEAPYAEVRVAGCDNVTFDANTVTGGGTNGFYVWGSVNNITFTNNLITTYSGMAFLGATNCKFINNIFATGEAGAFKAGDYSYSNNTIVNNIFIGEVGGATIDGTNICANNAYTVQSEAISTSDTNVFADAADIFVASDDGDYRLLATSPCIGTGSSASYVPKTDFNGVVRRIPSDIGMYSFGNIYYVSSSGKDTNDGLSKAAPFATFAKAVAEVKANPGSSLMVEAGNYTEPLNLDGIGNEKSLEVKVKSYNGTATLTGSAALTIKNSYNLDVSGFTVDAKGSDPAVVLSGAIGCKLHDTTITNGTVGLKIHSGTANCEIYNNNFSNGGGYDIYLKSSNNNKIYNNIFTAYYGILTEEVFTNTMISNNVFKNNASDGYAISSLDVASIGNTIQNNIVSSKMNISAKNTYNYNLYDSSAITTGVPVGEGTGSKLGDPSFIDDNYRIGMNSECRDAGTDVGAPLLDKDGNPRDGVTDIGAYEYISKGENFFISTKAPQGTGLSINKDTTKVQITFSEPLEEGLVLSDFISVTKADDGAVVPGKYVLNGSVVTFTADSNYAYSTTYNVTVKQGITNAIGKNLNSDGDVIWNFTTEVYVMDTYYIAMDGNDSNLGTIDSPKKTVTSIKNVLKPGDTVIWRAGTYDEYIVSTRTLPENGAPITFKAYEGETVTLTASSGPEVYGVIFSAGKNHNIRIEGLNFAPTKDQDYKSTPVRFLNFGGSSIYVGNCNFYRCSTSICIVDESNLTYNSVEICNNKIYGEGAYEGMYLRELRMADGCYAKIYNNVIYQTHYSLSFCGRNKNILFYNNTFADLYDSVGASGYYDIYQIQYAHRPTEWATDISENLVFKNNIFTKPIRTQLEGNKSLLDTTQNCIFDNNVYASNSLTSYLTFTGGGEGPVLDLAGLQAYQNRGLEAHGKYGAVTFVNTYNDARIIDPENAALDAATNDIYAGVSAPTYDINGNLREHNEAGAFAYDSSLAFVGVYDGADANGSLSKPYASIQDAVKAGATTIQLKAGTYDSAQTISSKVTVTPYDGEAIFTGDVSITGSDSYNVSISGVTFAGSVSVTGTKVTLSNSKFNGALSLNNANGVVVTNNTFAQSANDAVSLSGSENCTITNNVLTERSTAMKFTSASVGNKIYNNTMYGNTADVDLSTDSINNIFKNNIFSTNISSRANNIFDYNLYNKDTIAQGDLDAITEEHAVKESAGFINALAKDYRIYKLSACVGAGVMDENTPTKDINGITRSNTPDIGAYAAVAIKIDYFVDGTNGNDANAGTKEAPFGTIGAALKAVRDGETITVLTGEYNEDITLSDKTAIGADAYTIKGSGVVILNGIITLNNAVGVTIEGFTVNSGVADTAVSLTSSPYAKLNNLTLANVKTGINAVNSENLSINKVMISDVEKGIVLDGAGKASPVSISQSKVNNASIVAVEAKNLINLLLTTSIIKNSTEGILGTVESSFNIVNNTFYNNSGYSINITQLAGHATELNIFNNIFSRSQRGLGAFSCINKEWGFYSEYNLYDADASEIITHFYGNDQNLADTIENEDETCGRLGDPLFKDAANGDFALLKTSAAARTATKDIAGVMTAPEVDFAGTPYSTKSQDIGAIYTPYSLREIHIAGENVGSADGDGSIDKPFRTLQQAIDVVDSGDTIIIHKGVYFGRNDMADVHGVADAPVTIKFCDTDGCLTCDKNASLTRPIMTGKIDYTNPDEASNHEVMLKMVNCSYITIQGLDVTGFRGAGIWPVGCDNIVVQDCNIWDIDNPNSVTSGVEGLLINDTTNSLFKDINIWDIGQTRKSQSDHGAYIGGSTNCTFDGIKVHNAPGGGLQFYCGDNYTIQSRNCVVKNSVFSECKYGLILVNIEGFTITNNTFHNNWANDLYFDWTVNNNLIQNNVFYNDRTEPMDLGWIQWKPVMIGYQYNGLIENADGSTTSTITNNTIRNNMYDYKNFPAVGQYCAIDDTDNIPIDEFMTRENAAVSNNKYTDMKSGNASFVGSFSSTDTEYQKAEKIFNNILAINADSSCINAGLTEFAPTDDIMRQTRDSAPDLGAYEYVPVQQP